MRKLIIFGYIAAAILSVAGWSAAVYWKFESQDTQIKTLRADIKRMEEREDRIVWALDNTYNLLQEHMRRFKQPPEPKNIPLPTPKQQHDL